MGRQSFYTLSCYALSKKTCKKSNMVSMTICPTTNLKCVEAQWAIERHIVQLSMYKSFVKKIEDVTYDFSTFQINLLESHVFFIVHFNDVKLSIGLQYWCKTGSKTIEIAF